MQQPDAALLFDSVLYLPLEDFALLLSQQHIDCVQLGNASAVHNEHLLRNVVNVVYSFYSKAII